MYSSATFRAHSCRKEHGTDHCSADRAYATAE
jgi:hypothetical protein